MIDSVQEQLCVCRDTMVNAQREKGREGEMDRGRNGRRERVKCAQLHNVISDDNLTPAI